MFYSLMLLSKKGPLGTVWIAAHCYRKLKKDQVQQTNISSSVDKIIHDEVPVSAHRILAYLLLGVVRIYSKKVEYLFHDCNDVLDKLCNFKIGKSTHVSIGVGGFSRTHHSVKRPKRFELDAFDFQLLEDRNSGGRNLRPPEELMLKDGSGEEGSMSSLLYKEKMPYPEDSTTSHTPPRDVLSPHSMERELYVGPSHYMHDSAASPDIFRETSFSLDDRLEPMVLDEAEEELMHEKSSSDGLNNHERDHGSVAGPSNNRTDSVPVLEKDQGTEISLADHVDTMVLDETEKEQMNDKLKRQSFTEEEPHKSTKSVDETPVSKKRHRTDERAVSIIVDVTPDSKIAEHGVRAQDFTTVPTPAPRESRKILKKRKILFDSTLVVSNKAYKDWMKNARDLIRKKLTGPQTRLQAWRAHKFCRIPESFLEPLIPCISMNLCSLECKKKTSSSESLANQNDVSSPVVHENREETSTVRDVEKRKFPEDAPVAPGTPVTQVHLNSSRLHDETEAVAADSHNVDPTSSPPKEIQLDAVFYTEEENSSEGDGRQNNAYSARTRMAERYLCKNFISKMRRKEDEVLNLLQLLSGKTKKESARLFYEILVLKTLDCIDVQQESAYGDICLLKTSKFQA